MVAANTSLTNSRSTSASVSVTDSFHSQKLRGLMQLGESFKQLQIITQQNSIFDAQNSFDFEKDRFEQKSKAAEAGLKAAKIKGGFSIASGITSLGLSFMGNFSSKGFRPTTRKQTSEVRKAAEAIKNPHEHAKYLHDNRKLLNRHANWQMMGQSAMPVGNMINGIGDAASSGLTAEVNRDNNAAEMDKTLSGIASGDQKSTLDALQQVKESYRSLKQMLATMQGKISDARSAMR